MAELAREGSHTYFIRHLATEITRHVPSKQPARELEAIYNWVDGNIRYRNDPVGLEWVQSPQRTVEEGAGDCDDIGALLDALARSLGRPTRYETVGAMPGQVPHEHVYLQAQLPDGRWLTLDPVLEPARDTVGAPPELGPGWRAKGHTRTFDQDGRMLGAPTTARERLLWQTVPYFPQVPPTSGYANPVDAGRPMPPDWRYRSRRVGGKTIWEPTHSGVMERSGALGQPPEMNAWQFATQTTASEREAFIRAGGIVTGQSVSEALAPLAPLLPIAAAFIPGVGPVIAAGLVAGQIVGNVNAARPGVPQIDVTAAPGAPIPTVTVSPAAGPAGATVTLPTAAGGAMPRGRVSVTTTIGDWPARANAVQLCPADKTPRPELRSKYPPDARQLWDPIACKFRIFVPLAGGLKFAGLGECPVCPPGWTAVRAGTRGALPPSEAWAKHRSGLGQGLMIVPAAASLVPITAALGGPSISFHLSGANVPPHRHRVMLPSGDVIYTESDALAGWLAPGSPVLGQEPTDFASFRSRTAELAVFAAMAVQQHINQTDSPPSGDVYSVRVFQRSDATWPERTGSGKALLEDGKWGINTRTAAAWYLGVDVGTLPPVYRGFSNTLTWSPPKYISIVAPVSTAVAPVLAPVTAPPTTAPILTAVPTAPVVTTTPMVDPAPPPIRVATVTTTPPVIPAQYVPYTVTPPEKPPIVTAVPPRLPVTGPNIPPVPTGPAASCPVPLPALQQPPPCPPGSPASCPTGTQAAAPGGCPPGAVYRDASGNPRVTGYVEVAQEEDNPGMPPVGMDNPQRWPALHDPGHSGLSTVAASTAAAGDGPNLWLWALVAWVVTRKKGKS